MQQELTDLRQVMSLNNSLIGQAVVLLADLKARLDAAIAGGAGNTALVAQLQTQVASLDSALTASKAKEFTPEDRQAVVQSVTDTQIANQRLSDSIAINNPAN